MPRENMRTADRNLIFRKVPVPEHFLVANPALTTVLCVWHSLNFTIREDFLYNVAKPLPYNLDKLWGECYDVDIEEIMEMTRLSKDIALKAFNRVAKLGYAVPYHIHPDIEALFKKDKEKKEKPRKVGVRKTMKDKIKKKVEKMKEK